MKIRHSKWSFLLVVLSILSVFLLLRRDQSNLNSDREFSHVGRGNSTTKYTGHIPAYVREVYDYMKVHQQAPQGFIGGRVFNNRERHLPTKTPEGDRINYKEWDVHPHEQGVHRGRERLVTGDDGQAYFSSDHYNTFIHLNY